jgi:hypothetical protein
MKKNERILNRLITLKEALIKDPTMGIVKQKRATGLSTFMIGTLRKNEILVNYGTQRNLNWQWVGISPNLKMADRLVKEGIEYSRQNRAKLIEREQNKAKQEEVREALILKGTTNVDRKPFIQAIINVMTKSNGGSLNISLIDNKVSIQTDKVNFTTTDVVLFEEILNTIA